MRKHVFAVDLQFNIWVSVLFYVVKVEMSSDPKIFFKWIFVSLDINVAFPNDKAVNLLFP
jgi:hypothetical protein